MSKFHFKLEQYFNINHIRFTILHLIRGTRPDIYPQKKFCEIDFDSLLAQNNKIKYVILDKDNTLTLPYSEEISNPEKSALSALQNKLGWANVVLVSNSIGSSDDEHLHLIPNKEKKLSIRIIEHRSKKPNINLDNFVPQNLSMEEILVIGDRLMVDIYMGKSKGCTTLLVNAIDPKKDNFMVRFTRSIEDRLLKI